MFEEPIHFFVDVVKTRSFGSRFSLRQRHVRESVLARHYGMPEPGAGSNEWVRIDDADRYGRGGLLPMSVFLTMNAPGLRTSPVKRGYWVVRRVLGERIPPPPPTVPELPNDEANSASSPSARLLANIAKTKAAPRAIARFDAFGLVFEGFGPIGDRREKDFGGRPVDIRATFPGGGEGAGIDGLRTYIRAHRQQDFIDNLCRKLLAYGAWTQPVAFGRPSHR